MSSIIERLREYADAPCLNVARFPRLSEEAADLLEEAVKALEPFDENGKERVVDAPEWRDSDLIEIVVRIGSLRRARATLAKIKGAA